MINETRKRLFSIGDAAEYLGMSKNTVRKLSDLGELSAKRVNRHRMFTIEDLDMFVNTCTDWICKKDSQKVKDLGKPHV